MQFTIESIAVVSNSRTEAADDQWSSITSEILLNDNISPETFWGLKEFSHLEILFVFDKADPDKVIYTAQHPRENPAWPKAGIFAQRKKDRPNHIGSTIVELLEVKETVLLVKNLDAIDGTPIIDIKPVMKEFLPKTEVKQPQWATELMKNYW